MLERSFYFLVHPSRIIFKLETKLRKTVSTLKDKDTKFLAFLARLPKGGGAIVVTAASASQMARLKFLVKGIVL